MTKAGYTPPKPEIIKEPKPPKKKKKHKKKRGVSAAAAFSLVVFALAAIIGAGTIFVYLKTQPYVHTFVPGTMLSGYPLAGATAEEAGALLDTITEETLSSWQYTLTYGGQTYTLTGEDVKLSVDRDATLSPLWAAGREGGMLTRYLAMLRLSREPLIMQPVITYDLEPAMALLDVIRADIERGAKDATVSFKPGSATPFTFTDETVGLSVEAEPLLAAIEASLKKQTAAGTEIRPKEIEPKVYRAVLENAITMRSREVVRLVGDAAGAANAALAIRSLNGARVEAGQTLSFNEVVGRRTEENGYVFAPEPAYGADVSGVGGGVCQASTLLYRTALLGGLDVQARSAAVRPLDYCGMGQEAVVSDQGLELIICNPTDSDVFIMTRVYEDGGETMAEMTLIGEELSVRYALESLSEETGMIEEPIYVRDREGVHARYSDQRVPVGEALMGYTASVDRVTLDESGRETARENISENVYEAVAPTIYVGVEKRE